MEYRSFSSSRPFGNVACSIRRAIRSESAHRPLADETAAWIAHVNCALGQFWTKNLNKVQAAHFSVGDFVAAEAT